MRLEDIRPPRDERQIMIDGDDEELHLPEHQPGGDPELPDTGFVEEVPDFTSGVLDPGTDTGFGLNPGALEATLDDTEAPAEVRDGLDRNAVEITGHQELGYGSTAAADSVHRLGRDADQELKDLNRTDQMDLQYEKHGDEEQIAEYMQKSTRLDAHDNRKMEPGIVEDSPTAIANPDEANTVPGQGGQI